MSKFHRTHIAIFDKLKRQGVRGVDVGRLTRATLSATDLIAAYEGDRLRLQPQQPRCASGACDE